jgi:hypothetical protein
MSLIERIGEKRIEFYCWKLFIIDYFHAYEVSAEYKKLKIKLKTSY